MSIETGKWGQWQVPPDVVKVVSEARNADWDWAIVVSEDDDGGDGEEYLVVRIFEDPTEFKIIAAKIVLTMPYQQPADSILWNP